MFYLFFYIVPINYCIIIIFMLQLLFMSERIYLLIDNIVNKLMKNVNIINIIIKKIYIRVLKNY